MFTKLLLEAEDDRHLVFDLLSALTNGLSSLVFMDIPVLAVLLPNGDTSEGGSGALSPASVLWASADIPEGCIDRFSLDGTVLRPSLGVSGFNEGLTSGREAAFSIRAQFVAGRVMIEEIHGSDSIVNTVWENFLLSTTQIKSHELAIDEAANIDDTEDIASTDLPADSARAT